MIQIFPFAHLTIQSRSLTTHSPTKSVIFYGTETLSFTPKFDPQ